MRRALRFWFFLGVFAYTNAFANDKVWVGFSKVDPRDWNDGENWLPPGAPSSGDRVYIGVSPHSGTYTVNIKQSIDLAELALVRSTLNGAVLVNVNGAFSSEGGSLSGGLQVVLKSGGGAKNGGGGEFALGLYGARIENQGTFGVSTNGTLGFSQQPSTFVNKGIVELAGGAGISFSGAGNSLFENQGTLRNAADGTISSLDNVALNNTGTIVAQSGTLRFTLSRITNNATIRAEGNATNLFTGGTLVSSGHSMLEGSGWHRLVGADWLISGNPAAALVEFSGGSHTLTLTPGSVLDANGNFRWTSGTIASSTNAGKIESTALVEISGSDTKALDGALFENAGDASWTGTGSIQVRNGGEFVNQGTFRIENNSDFSGSGIFQNEGQVQKSNSDTNAFTTFNTDFNNNKSVLVSKGNLGLTSGTSRGSFVVNKDAELQFFARRHTVNGQEGANFSGDGFTVIADTAIFEVRGSVPVENLWLAGDGIAAIQLSGELSVSGTFNWSAGTIFGLSGTNDNVVTITAPGLGAIRGANKKTLDNAILRNESTTTWRDSGDWALVNGARFENDSGKSFIIYNDAKVLGGGKESTFHNAGKLSKTSALTGAAGATVIGAGVRFEHGVDPGSSPFNALLQIVGGTLRLEGGGELAAATRIDEGCSLEFRQGKYNLGGYGGITGAGWARVTGATLIYSVLLSPFTLEGFPVSIDNLELASGVIQAAPNFGFRFDFNVTASFKWTGGTIGGQEPQAGTVFISQTETLVSGPDQKRIDQAKVELLGRASWDGAGPLVMGNSSRVYLGSADQGVAFDCFGDFALLRDGTSNEIFTSPKAAWHLKPTKNGRIEVDVENSGALVFENGAYTLRKFTLRKGKVDLNGSQLKIANGLDLSGGALSGDGTIDGPLRNNGGDLNPGHSPGHIVINGDLQQSALGRTAVQIGGYQASERDLIEVSGNASIDGTLRLELLNNFLPKGGDRFEVMKFGSRSNTFAVREGMLLSPSLVAIPEYSATNMVLVINSVAAQTISIAVDRAGGALRFMWPNISSSAQLETSIDLDRWLVLSNINAMPSLLTLPINASEPRRFFRLR